jgi:hypothetical protein
MFVEKKHAWYADKEAGLKKRAPLFFVRNGSLTYSLGGERNAFARPTKKMSFRPRIPTRSTHLAHDDEDDYDEDEEYEETPTKRMKNDEDLDEDEHHEYHVHYHIESKLPLAFSLNLCFLFGLLFWLLSRTMMYSKVNL